jgi:hypothetical protein
MHQHETTKINVMKTPNSIKFIEYPYKIQTAIPSNCGEIEDSPIVNFGLSF